MVIAGVFVADPGLSIRQVCRSARSQRCTTASIRVLSPRQPLTL
jgi:hypothetical protein